MKKQKVLVIGASGFLGQALMKELPKKFDAIGTYNSNPVNGFIKFDLGDLEKIKKGLSTAHPDIVVLAAADANVDSYESNPDISRMQISSAEKISEWCRESNALLAFFSTDFVFDGKKGNYSESDIPNPINQYGRNKLEIEKIVSSVPEHLVLRTSTLYGLPVLPGKFIGKTISKLSHNETIEAAADWKRSPTLTKDLAVALRVLLEKKHRGLFHVAGASQLSMFDMALAIARELNSSDSLVKKGVGNELRLPAKRPLDTTIDISKIRKLGIKMSSFEQGIKFVCENMGK